MRENNQSDMLMLLTGMARQVSFGQYEDLQRLFEFSKSNVCSDSVLKLVDAFGMMAVKVEARESRMYQIIRELRETNNKFLKNHEKFSSTLQELKHFSTRDPMTKMYNRCHMKAFLEREISKAMHKKTSVGLLMVDMDNFNDFKELYGNEEYNLVLENLAGCIKRTIGNEDIACRYGKTEFVLIIPEISLAIAIDRAEEICLNVRESLQINKNGHKQKITVSIGAVAFPSYGNTPEELLGKAEASLYLAKARGRDQVASC